MGQINDELSFTCSSNYIITICLFHIIKMVKVYCLSTNVSIPSMETEFDALLRREWKDRMERGVFRYPFQRPLREKILEKGSYKFLLQLNTLRSTNRRTPQCMTAVDAPFNSDLFHFGKIKDEEILFEVQEEENISEGSSTKHLLIINASPFETCHSLLIPKVLDCLPQILTPKAIELALQIAFASGVPGLRLAFNSLCAYASVNHCHWHVYYLNQEQYIQSCELIPLHERLIWGFKDYSAQGFVFLISNGAEIPSVSRRVAALTDFLVKEKIAHNVLMVKGVNETIRVIIWARNSVVGNKDPQAFGIAVCELGGQILIYQPNKFDCLSEEDIVQAHEKATLPFFEVVKNQLKNIVFEL